MGARVIAHRKGIVILFLILAAVSAVAQFFVSVNYNIVDYLPDDAKSTEALKLMEKEFTAAVPNTRVMVPDISLQEALLLKEELASIDGVTDILWLDDVIDVKTPLEMADEETVETYYKDGNALFSISVRSGGEVEITDSIYELIGANGAISGEAINTATSQKMAGTESFQATLLLVPIIIIILVLSTNSWAEPFFFLTAIGVSVIINLGTNLFIGEVSFVTQSVAPILQLAVSLDYAVFLLHSFSDYRKEGFPPEKAMELAMKRSFSAITASAATTFFGFIALTFMEFEIGSDLGLNLVKGIVLSFISVMVFLPAFTLLFHSWLEKSQHKPFVPSFKGIGKMVVRLRTPSLIVILLLIVPTFLAQKETAFTYGLGELPESTRAGKDYHLIEETFGKTTPVVLLVPKGEVGKETALVHELEELDYVTSVMAYVNTVGSVIPPEFLEPSITNEFYSKHYSRIVINTNQGTEGEIPFSIVENVEALAEKHYGENSFSLGESVTLYDIKKTVTKDNVVVNGLTILSIAIVLIVTFRSLSLPIALLLTIQTSVWINLSIPYFTGTSLVFVGYLIVSTVQLAATVDYAILLTETYLQFRKQLGARAAIIKTLDEKTFSISISAVILSSVGFILWGTSTNPIVSSIGLLIGRGALLAFLMVLLVLPALLLLFDKLIQKTTYKADFFKES